MLATFLVGTATDFQLKTKLCKNLECVLGLYFFTRALNCAQKERLSFHSSPRNQFCRQCNCSERNCIAKGPIPSTRHHGGLEFGVNISHIRYVNLPIARFVQIRSQCTRNTSNISDHKYEIRQLRIFQKMVDKGMPKSSLFCAPCWQTTNLSEAWSIDIIVPSTTPLHRIPHWPKRNWYTKMTTSRIRSTSRSKLIAKRKVWARFFEKSYLANLMFIFSYGRLRHGHWLPTWWNYNIFWLCNWSWLPHRKGIAIHPDLTYAVLRWNGKSSTDSRVIIVARGRVEALVDILESVDHIADIQGRHHKYMSYGKPIWATLRIWPCWCNIHPLIFIPLSYPETFENYSRVPCNLWFWYRPCPLRSSSWYRRLQRIPCPWAHFGDSGHSLSCERSRKVHWGGCQCRGRGGGKVIDWSRGASRWIKGGCWPPQKYRLSCENSKDKTSVSIWLEDQWTHYHDVGIHNLFLSCHSLF